MTVDHRFDYLDSSRSVLNVIVYPLQYLATLPVTFSDWSSENLAQRSQLVEENQALRNERMFLHLKLQKMAALERENARLRELLASANRFEDERVIVAELLAVDLDPYKQQVVINKGSQDEVYVGQPLLDARGVMGQITHVFPMSSAAILISDPSHALPVQVNRNGLRTLAVGTGNPDLLSLRHVPTSGDIKIGDIVSTSGLGGRFPADYPVAEIIQIERPQGEPFAFVKAKPYAQLDRSREVLLLWWKPQDTAESQSEP
jgi:rod shape-determining protein MreC